MTNQDIAQEIMNQLGGMNRLAMMMGMNQPVIIENGVRFRFKMCSDYNMVHITLNSMDTYDLEFCKVWGTKVKNELKIEGVYCDQLKKIIQDTTKLYLSL